MTTEKKKAAFYFFTQGKESKLVGGAYPRKSGNGYCVKIGEQWYSFYLPKAKPELQTEEEGA